LYRPTVRYSDIYKKYVDDLFQATTLDRNQIIRAALFTAAHSKDFIALLEAHKRGDVSTPSPSWSLSDSPLWKDSNPQIKERGKDVNANNGGKTSAKTDNVFTERGRDESGRRQQSNERREREIYKREGGGISIRIG
jgi:hypothetical protein